MLRPSSPRLLLLLPTVTYRTVAFVEAARRLGADLTVASERPSTFERANPTGLVTLDFADPTHAAAQAREFARAHPVHGVVAVDDDTAVVAAAIAEALGLRGNPVRSEEHTSELQSRLHLVCRLLLEKKKIIYIPAFAEWTIDD